MNAFLIRLAFAVAAVLTGVTQASAALPSGSVTFPAVRTMAVTVVDSDYHSVPIGLFIDGALYDSVWLPNSVTGTRTYAPFGPGPLAQGGAHTVAIWAFDVNSAGVRTGAAVQLTGSPTSFFETCSVFANPAQSWCGGVTDYYRTRQQTTKAIFNDYAWAGVATGMGGTIMQLYDHTRSVNLLAEHGGAAMQLGIWGYDVNSNPTPAWFKSRTCDATPYAITCAIPDAASPACGCPDPPFCNVFGTAGAHVANCTTVVHCEGWSAGAPWNVMPARGGNCTWGVPVTLQAQLYPQDPRIGWRIELDNPFNFTKSSSYPGKVVQEVRALPGTEYIQLDLEFRNYNPIATGAHDQEFPALHFNYNFDWMDWRYSSDSSPDGIHVTVPMPLGQETGARRLLGPGAPSFYQGQPGTIPDWNGEWVTACGNFKDNPQVRKCVTFATFDADIKMATMCNNCNLGASGMTPLGFFGMTNGSVIHATVFLFPYSYSEAPLGIRVLDRINSLGSR